MVSSLPWIGWKNIFLCKGTSWTFGLYAGPKGFARCLIQLLLNSCNLFMYFLIESFLLFSDTSVLCLNKDVSIFVKTRKKISLKGIAVFLPLAEACLTVKMVRKLTMQLCKIVAAINTPVDFFHRLFPNTRLRRWLPTALTGNKINSKWVLYMKSVEHSSKCPQNHLLVRTQM